MIFPWLQLIFDGAVVGLFVVWIVTRKKAATSNDLSNESAEYRVALERLKHIELGLNKYREKLDSELISLRRICDEAAHILSRTRIEAHLESTLEEAELRSSVLPQQEDNMALQEKIPTLYQIEKMQGRIVSDLKFDLRSLLKEQLV